MSKQRRRRLTRTKYTRSHRSFVRNGVEPLESRVLPGGFLDLLAGAAFASNFDSLLEECLIPEEVESESDTSVQRTRSPHSVLQVGLSLPDLDFEPSEDRVELDPSSETFEFATASPATKSLPVTSLIDSFFATNQFVTPSPNHLVTPSPPLFLSTPSFSSPISQLGAGVGIGSGQGYNVTGSELPMPNVVVPVGSVSSMPAWMLGEGEGGATASGSVISVASGSGTSTATSSATSSASGLGVTTTMVSATATASATGTTQTVSSCEGLPTTAGPLVIRKAVGGGTEEAEGWLPGWLNKDDAANEGLVLVVGNPTNDETDPFEKPIDIPGVDQSYLAWLEVTRSRSYDELIHFTSRGNQTLDQTLSIAVTRTSEASHSQVNTSSQAITAAVAGQLGNLGVEVSTSVQATASSSASVVDTVNLNVAPCTVNSIYNQYRVTEVTLKYVFYVDHAAGLFQQKIGTTTIISRENLGYAVKPKDGTIVTHTMTT